MYIGRRQAITTSECFNLVDELRKEWEKETPKLVLKELGKRDFVYSSKADARERKRGEKCEAVHYLIFITVKLFNKASQLLASIKKKETLAVDSGLIFQRHEVELPKQSIPEAETLLEKAEWRQNPGFHMFLEEARQSVSKKAFADETMFKEALQGSIAKLVSTNKPNLHDSLKYLASIIALKDFAVEKCWHIERKF